MGRRYRGHNSRTRTANSLSGKTMSFTGPLTILLWLGALAIGAIGFTKTRSDSESRMAFALRLMFGLMLALSVWVVVSYALWLAGVDLFPL